MFCYTSRSETRSLRHLTLARARAGHLSDTLDVSTSIEKANLYNNQYNQFLEKEKGMLIFFFFGAMRYDADLYRSPVFKKF